MLKIILKKLITRQLINFDNESFIHTPKAGCESIDQIYTQTTEENFEGNELRIENLKQLLYNKISISNGNVKLGLEAFTNL